MANKRVAKTPRRKWELSEDFSISWDGSAFWLTQRVDDDLLSGNEESMTFEEGKPVRLTGSGIGGGGEHFHDNHMILNEETALALSKRLQVIFSRPLSRAKDCDC